MSGERKERKKNQMTTSDSPTTVSCHAPLHMKKGTLVHIGKQQKASFGHQVTSHILLDDAYGTHSLTFVEHMSTMFSY
jgi:hypothetical protein